MFPCGNMSRIATPTELGSLIRATRRAQGLQQEDLALAAGTGRRFIIDLERGKATAQLGATLRVLAALGLAVHIAPPGEPASGAPDG